VGEEILVLSHAWHTRPWDEGVCWFLEQLEAPDLTKDPLLLAAVRDDHLRSPNGTAEDDYITRLMTTSLRMAERVTNRSLLPTLRRQVMDRFPCEIVLQHPPLASVESIVYVDPDGAEQTILGGSPEMFWMSAPLGPRAPKGRLRPLYGTWWPATRCQPDAVRVTYTGGYPLVGSPEVSEIPEDITQGRLLVIGELYKQRSESVHTFNQNPALIRARSLWLEYRLE
jgi:uncharacterized phiE125 gp8 family phage protein